MIYAIFYVNFPHIFNIQRFLGSSWKKTQSTCFWITSIYPLWNLSLLLEFSGQNPKYSCHAGTITQFSLNCSQSLPKYLQESGFIHLKSVNHSNNFWSLHFGVWMQTQCIVFWELQCSVDVRGFKQFYLNSLSGLKKGSYTTWLHDLEPSLNLLWTPGFGKKFHSIISLKILFLMFIVSVAFYAFQLYKSN